MKPLAFLTLLAALVATGWLHGHCSGRWDARVGEVPQILQSIVKAGDWEGGKTLQIDAREIAFQTSAEHRVFMHKPTGRYVVLSLTTGRPAVVAVHTPDVCYLGSGFQAMTRAKRMTVPTKFGDAQLWCCDFQKNEERLRVYWAWATDELWQAPDSPRWDFARAAQLRKLYVVHPVNADDDLTPNDDSLKTAAALLEAVGESSRIAPR